MEVEASPSSARDPTSLFKGYKESTRAAEFCSDPQKTATSDPLFFPLTSLLFFLYWSLTPSPLEAAVKGLRVRPERRTP